MAAVAHLYSALQTIDHVAHELASFAMGMKREARRERKKRKKNWFACSFASRLMAFCLYLFFPHCSLAFFFV